MTEARSGRWRPGRADVVALHEEQLNSHAAIERELFREVLMDMRPGWASAGGQQASVPQLHHADAACTNRELSSSRAWEFFRCAGGLEDGVALMRRHQLTINATEMVLFDTRCSFVLHHVTRPLM